jgi:hypothetical protein
MIRPDIQIANFCMNRGCDILADRGSIEASASRNRSVGGERDELPVFGEVKMRVTLADCAPLPAFCALA